MSNLVLDSLNWRYATKQFDPTRAISAEDWATLEASLVLTPSSCGLQPWKFLIVQDPALRAQLLPHSWGQRQVVDCSHLVVIATKLAITEADLDFYLARISAIRGTPIESLAGFRGMLTGLFGSHTGDDTAQWAAKQAYIALGQFMLAAALLHIDTCPMEGFVPAEYDKVLGLAGTGYTTTILCPAGYRAPEDKYATLPKVRYPADQLIEWR